MIIKVRSYGHMVISPAREQAEQERDREVGTGVHGYLEIQPVFPVPDCFTYNDVPAPPSLRR